MANVDNFEDLEVWQRARNLTRSIYAMTSEGQFAKDYALVNQMRRASISILSNIAEGFERNGDKEFVQFLLVANGSCGEVRAQLYVALDQEYIDGDLFAATNSRLMEASRMISGLIKYLRQSELKGSRYKTANSE